MKPRPLRAFTVELFVCIARSGQSGKMEKHQAMPDMHCMRCFEVALLSAEMLSGSEQARGLSMPERRGSS